MDAQTIIARRIARELQPGMLVNLGIGIPTLVANYVAPGIHVFFQSENGLGRAAFPSLKRMEEEVVGFGLDHADYVVGGDRQPEAAGAVVHELSDDSLASLVKLFGLEVETLDRASERIAKQLHFRLPVGFTPSALRNAR